MSTPFTFVQIGDLHADEADGYEGVARLNRIVDELNGPIGAGVDLVFVPGDNANHGTSEQFRRVVAELDRLRLPWRIIPGDHDFEPGNLHAYEAAIPAPNRPEAETIGGTRCIFLDIVSAGAGGPDFRLTTHHRRRLAEELTRARAEDRPIVLFMHGYPGDLAADGEEVATRLAQAGVAFVATGHTHYNELLNDGHVLYGATRSTAQIEEGPPGYSIVTVRDGVVTWHFRELGQQTPLVRIVGPSDLKLVTRPFDRRQIPRPGRVSVIARVAGGGDLVPRLSVDGARDQAMMPCDGEWSAQVDLASGLHRLTVTCGASSDIVDVLARPADTLPKRPPPIALGRDVHAIGAWPDRSILGTQLGPNRNGGKS